MLADRRIRQFVNLTAVTLVGYLLASAAAVLVTAPRLPDPAADRPSADKGVVKNHLPSLNFFDPILGRNVFKAAVDTAREPGATGTAAALPKLKAVLLGTMASDEPSLSRAVVLEGNAQRLVKVGDTLEGTRVAEIRRRALLLEAGGQRRLLTLDAAPDTAGKDKPVGRVTLSRAAVKKALQDIPALAASIRFAEAAHDADRRLWIRQIRLDSLFGRAGLRKGDIILRVGGQDVDLDTRPEDFFNLLESSQVDVDLVRDGSPLTLSLAWTK